MAVLEEAIKKRVTIKLNDGLDASGNVKTVSTSLGNLSVVHYDDAKALAVIGALEDCLSKTIYRIEKTTTSEIEEE